MAQYRRQDRLTSDVFATEVRADAAPTTAYVETDAIGVRGYREIDFFVTVTKNASLSSVTVKPQSSCLLGDGGTEVWGSEMVESLTSGVATTYQYEVVLNDPTPTGASGSVTYKVTFPCSGSTMRLGVKANAAAGSVQISALRRV